MLPLRDENPTRRFPVVTVALVVVNVVVYFLLQQPAATNEASGEVRFVYEYAAIPCEVITGDALDAEEITRTLQFGEQEACIRDPQPGVPEVFSDKRVWVAVVVSMFLHGSLLHLAGNLLFLWIFGNNVEDRLGPVRYVGFYLLAGVLATLVHIGFQPASTVPLVGASGAIAGVMGAYLVWFPRARILTLVTFFLIEIPAMWVLGFWFISQFFINPMSGVASMAHVGGFVFGVIAGFVMRPRRPLRPGPRPPGPAPGRPVDPMPW
jgi:membrane associated rhomboid family serine protease